MGEIRAVSGSGDYGLVCHSLAKVEDVIEVRAVRYGYETGLGHPRLTRVNREDRENSEFF